MKNKTEELLIITLAIVIFTSITLVIQPTFTGNVIHELTINENNNIIINETIQLKQHQITTTTQEIVYSNLILAEKTEYEENGEQITDVLSDLQELDNKELSISPNSFLRIIFNNQLRDNDVITLFMGGSTETNINIKSIDNETVGTLSYQGEEGLYQTTLTNLQTNELIITPLDNVVKINHINATSLITIENTTYYYIPTEVETEIIQPKKWDLFTSNYTLNNQTITFYYKTNQEYIEFTPPFNFSEINTSLQFKLFLNSNNISTPIIHDLFINYIEIQETNETEPENGTGEDSNQSEDSPHEDSPQLSSSTGLAPSKISTKSKTKTPKTVSKEIEIKTVSQPIEVKTTPEPKYEIIDEETYEKTLNKPKLITNLIAFSYLLFICLLIYKQRHNL